MERQVKKPLTCHIHRDYLKTLTVSFHSPRRRSSYYPGNSFWRITSGTILTSCRFRGTNVIVAPGFVYNISHMHSILWHLYSIFLRSQLTPPRIPTESFNFDIIRTKPPRIKRCVSKLSIICMHMDSARSTPSYLSSNTTTFLLEEEIMGMTTYSTYLSSSCLCLYFIYPYTFILPPWIIWSILNQLYPALTTVDDVLPT